MIVEASDIDTTVTGRSTGHPVQVLRNKLSRKFDQAEKAQATLEELEALGRGSLYQSVILGDRERGSFMAGQIAGMVNQSAPAKDLIKKLLEDCQSIPWREER